MGSNKPKYLQPDDVAEDMRPYIDFTKQELRGKRGRRRLRVWVQCPDCQQWRWVTVGRLRGEYESTRCQPCVARRLARKYHPAYEDWYDNRGYRRIAICQLEGADRVLAEAMRNSIGTIEEHRLVVARCLGRPLESKEHVHHLDGERASNAPDNLMITSAAFHSQVTRLEYWTERETLTTFTDEGVPYQVRARVVFERV